MTAKAKNLLTGKVYGVHTTTQHADSSYGIPVWVITRGKLKGLSVCQYGFPSLGWAIFDVQGVDDAEN